MGLSRLGVLALAGIIAVIVPLAAFADDRTSLEAGRTVGRGLLILRDPKVCAIALVRERCRADVEAFLAGRGDADFKDVPNVGPHPASGLRAFVTTGERDKLDRALSWMNSGQSTPAMWNADARDAALYDAGIEDVLLSGAEGNFAGEYLSIGPVIDLSDHVGQIPAGALPLDLAPIRRAAGAKKLPTGAMKFAHDLVKALDTAMPGPPLVAMRYADGAAGDAALGVASSTIAELIDSPAWLVQADAQRFLDDYVARVAAVAPGSRTKVAQLRESARGGVGFKHDLALEAYSALVGSVLRGDQRRAPPTMLGSFAAQLVYNAAVLRDPRYSLMFLRNLDGETALDNGVPGWAMARLSAGRIAPDDWGAQYQLGVRLVDLIQKANGS